jgi:GxxExxY protein
MDTTVDLINGLTEKIIGCSFRVLNTLGTGFLEKVYQNALAHELRKQGLTVALRHPIPTRRLIRQNCASRSG